MKSLHRKSVISLLVLALAGTGLLFQRHSTAQGNPAMALIGDVNGDKVVDLKDVQQALRVAIGLNADASAKSAADVDGNGSVNLLDVVKLLVAVVNGQSLPSPATPAGDTTPKVVAAAQSFLATLNATQLAKVSFGFNDQAQRVKWSNFPQGIFSRNGLRMGDLSAEQRQAAMAVVSSTLSAKGFQKTLDIMNGDQVLKGQGGAGGNLTFGSDYYYISILGTPSTDTPWMWQFGGHHLAINATIVKDKIVLTPTLTAAQPANFTFDGKTVRPLGAENDKAFALGVCQGR